MNLKKDVETSVTPNVVADRIGDFLAQRNVDYGIMISGDWGVGKTYFIQNKLDSILKTVKMNPVYVSLNGVQGFGDVVSQIVFGTGTKLTKVFTSGFLMPLAAKYLPEKTMSMMLTGLKKLSECKSKNPNLLIKTKDDLSPAKHVLFVDDLERTHDDHLLAKIMGRIFDEFIIKGYHVVFIACEKPMTSWNLFGEEKEKYIRHTIKYSPDIPQVVNALVNACGKDTRQGRYGRRIEDDLIKFAARFHVENVRTIKRILDEAVRICELLNDEALFSRAREWLFYTLAPLVNEIARGRLIPSKREHISSLENIDQARYSHKFTTNTNEDRHVQSAEFIDQFINEYDTALMPIRWQYSKPIVEFACFGTVGIELLREEVERRIPKKVDAYHVALNMVWPVSEDLEDDQLQDSSKKIVEGLKNGKYCAGDVVLALELLLYYKSKGCLTEDVKKVIELAEKGLQLRWKSIPDDHINPMLLRSKKSSELLSVMKVIRGEHEKRARQKEKEEMLLFLRLLKDKNRDKALEIACPQGRRSKIFARLVDAGMQKEVCGLGNWALSLLGAILDDRKNFTDGVGMLDECNSEALRVLASEVSKMILSPDVADRPLHKESLTRFKQRIEESYKALDSYYRHVQS